MTKKRLYNYRDVDMLMAAKAIGTNFLNNISELSAIRTDYTEEKANNLLSDIDTAIENHLGIDAKKELRQATANINAIQAPAKRDLSFFKTQVEADFNDEPGMLIEILTTLGFTKHLHDVQQGNQEALVHLLYSFNTNMTDNLRSSITEKGMSPALIDRIIDYANTFRDANVSQETLKITTKEITNDAVDMFNDIYKKVISICKIAAGYYQYEPLKKEQFTFSKAIENIGTSHTQNVQPA